MKKQSLFYSPSFRPFLVGSPTFIWQILFFYLPLLFMIVSSFLHFSPTGEWEGFSLQSMQLFLSPIYLHVILSSIFLALCTAIICLLIGYPLAYCLAFMKKKYRYVGLFLLFLPFWTNFLLHVYAWFYVLDTQGFLNQILLYLHIIDHPLEMLNTFPAIILMMVYYYLPFMVLPIYSSLEKFNPYLLEASLDLGASWLQTLRRIIFPLTLKGVRAGFFLVYIPAFGEFAIPELMGGDKWMFVGNVISQYILAEGTQSLGSAFTLFSALCLVISSGFIYYIMPWLVGGKIHEQKK